MSPERPPRARAVRHADQADEMLVRAAVAGEGDAFSELVARHRRSALRTAASIVGPDRAEDVVQDALFLAFRALPTLKDRTKFLRWLLTITRFRALRVGRIEGRRIDVQLDSKVLETLSDLACRPRRDVSGDEILREAIEELPPEFAEIIRLHFLHGLPHRRIAQLLGVSVSLVKWRCSRGKEIIRRLMRPERAAIARIEARCARCRRPALTANCGKHRCAAKNVKGQSRARFTAPIIAALLLLGSGLAGAAPLDDWGVPDLLDDGMAEDVTPAKPGSRPTTGTKVRVRTLARYAVPDVKLVDQTGRSVSLVELLGGDKPVVLNFFFASCSSICPIMTSTLSQMRRKLGREGRGLRMVSITIDPDQDSPEVLRGYAKSYSAGRGWSFLTGDARTILGVQHAFGADTGGKFNHRLLYFFRAAGSSEWVRLEGQASAADLAAEVRALRPVGPAKR